MFFLITNISIGKYYPNIVTQFIFGIVCYSVVLFILKDFISVEIYEEYKYYAGIAIIVDTTFLLYQYKYNSIKTVADNNSNKIIPYEINQQSTIKSAVTTELDVSFGSDFDVDDYKIAHDLSPNNDTEKTGLPVSESDSCEA